MQGKREMITPMDLDRAPWPTCDLGCVDCGVGRLERHPAIVLIIIICTIYIHIALSDSQ